jgi:phosphate starvation-inducible protein PhoH
MASTKRAKNVALFNEHPQHEERQQQKTGVQRRLELIESDERKLQHQPVVNNALKIKLEHLKTFSALTENQAKFFDAYDRGDYFISLHGVAGSGKTFTAFYKAITEVLRKDTPFERIVVVRSAVPSREIGHLPGSITEKLEIYSQPYVQICQTLFGRKDAWARLEEQGVVEFISTSYIRGMSFDDSIIIVDELQNCTFEELDGVITRCGHRSKIIFVGDYRQTDLNKKRNDMSGIFKFFDIAESMTAFTKIEFTPDDIVRSSLVKDYIIAKMKYEDSLNV